MPTFKYLLTAILISALVAPNVTLALEGALGGTAVGSAYGGTSGSDASAGSSEGSAGDSGDSPSESGPGPGIGPSDGNNDGSGDSPSESGPGPGMGGADAEATSQAAADAQAAASYGMTGDVDVNATAEARMNGTIDNDQVAMGDGTTQSLSAGEAAADAISAANLVGGYVDVDATHAAYQNGDMVPGTVVGSLTGTVGYPAAVAKAEINAAVTKSTVDAIAAINNSAATAYAATAKDLAGAISLAANPAVRSVSMISTDDTRAQAIQDYRSSITSGVVSVSSYQQGMAQSFYSGPKGATTPNSTLSQDAKDAYSNAGKYSFDLNATTNDVAGGWVDQNGRAPSGELGKSLNSIASEVAGQIANTKHDVAVTYDMKTGKVSFSNLDTGIKTSPGLSDFTGKDGQTQNSDKTSVGQEFGKTYSGPKGVSVTDINRDFVNSILGPGTGLNAAAQYAARISKNQQPVSVPTKNIDDDSRITAGLAMAEDPQPTLAMETIVNRALARKKSIRSIAASTEYQPVLDLAKKMCNCSTDQVKNDQDLLNRALDQIVSASSKKPGFEGNVTKAKSMISGTNVMTGLDEQKGYVDFTNVSLAIEQGRASKNTIAEVTVMKANPNSTTLRPGKFNEQTFGIRPGSKAPDYTPKSTNFNAYKDISSDVTSGTGPSSNVNPNTNPSTDTKGKNPNPTTNDRKPSDVGSVLGGVLGGPIGSIIGGLLGAFLGKQNWTPGGPSTIKDRGDSMRLCPPYPISCQGGAAILALPSLASVSSWFDGLWSNDEVATENQEILNNIVPVLITVNHKTGEIEINRPDIIATLEEPSKYYTTEQWNTLEKLLNETSILFGDNGSIVYSNGLYSPPVQYGERVGQNVPEYVYTVEYIDETGNVINIEDGDAALPDNAATNLVRSILGSTAPFSISDVISVTYRVVDPKTEVLGDEYYDYVITLVGEDVRGITIPQFTSTAYMQKRFEQLGFSGRATDLISIATETTEIPEQGLLSRLFTLVSNAVSQFTNVETPQGSTTELPQLAGDLTGADIEKVFIYPVTDITCPADVAGYETGFMYTAVIKNHVSPDYVTMVSDGRCGYGDPNQLVTEVAHHLETAYGIKDVTYDSIVDRSLFINETTAFEQIITNVYRPSASEPTAEIPTEPVIETPATTTPEQKPNLTNDVTLEVKAVGGDGKILLDWSTASSITISTGVSLYFRWDGSDYQQCLPFLQDNGSYALTRKDRAMLKGDTESEGFNVPERTATYRVECGGQRNNEFGVDERGVEVTLE